LLLTYLDYRLFGPLAPYLYVLAALLLIVVLVVGDTTYGARRWLDLVVLPLQPSEVAKLCLIIALAKLFSDRQASIRQWNVLIMSILVTGGIVSLVFLQPDLGTAVIFTSLWLGIAEVAGVRIWHLLQLAVLGGILAPLFAARFFSAYMWDRLATHFNPASDPLGAGYNVLQAEISIGSGGLFGKGFLEGTQSQLAFLRIQRIDYIFSVLGEELGFVGAVVLFALFLVLIWRGLRTASLSQDAFGRLLATGIVTMVLVQSFINIAGNVRLLPITGVPLPFISYGGSSLITFLASMGILQSILLRHRKLNF
jgi:rod shape determining protein RodA